MTDLAITEASAIEEDGALLAPAEAPPVLVLADGWVINPDTGEVFGHAADDSGTHKPFDRGYAEWVLEKMQEAEGLIMADEAKLRAISGCIQARIKHQRARLEWLRRRFLADMEQFARIELEEGRARTLVLDHGKLSFRRAAGSIEVTDHDAALAWARIHAPEAIKITESVRVTPLKDRQDLPRGAFEVRLPCDRFTVQTGVLS